MNATADLPYMLHFIEMCTRLGGHFQIPTLKIDTRLILWKLEPFIRG